MKLAAWRDLKGYRYSRISKDLDVSVSTVTRWCSGESIPKPAMIGEIRIYTDGMVKPNDWYGEPGEPTDDQRNRPAD